MKQASATDRIPSLVAAVVLLSVLAVAARVATTSDLDRQLWRAGEALEHRQFSEAERLANEILEFAPQNPAALVIAGEAAAGLHENDIAISYFKRVPLDDSLESYRASLGLALRLHFKGQMGEAEQYYRRVLEKTPDLPLANKRLTDLLQIEGRNWEAIEPAMRIIRQGIFGAAELHAVACPETRIRNDKVYLAKALEEDSDSPYPLLAEARISALQNRESEAEDIYRRILALDETTPDAVFRLGRIFINDGRFEEFIALDENSAQQTDAEEQHRLEDYGGVWLNRGLTAVRYGQHRAAIRCFGETLRRWPNHVEANYLISQSLAAVGEVEAAEVFGERSRILSRIELTIPEFYDDPTEERIQALRTDFEKLGRFWEAAAMCSFAGQLNGPTPRWAEGELRRLKQIIENRSDVVITPAPLALLSPLDQFPIPDWSEAKSTVASEDPVINSEIHFGDVAADVGLEFTYFNGSLNQRGMEHIFETTGGGIASFDYDLDGQTDIYFTQGAPLWEGDDRVQRSDELFRNRQGERFQAVHLQADLGDKAFGQGVTYCDFNSDGFPDIYVGNLGGNVFYRNNGDGTFTEITDETSTAGDEWTLSCVFADFDGDSLQDLYVVNYLQKQAVFDRRCKSNGAPLTCAPTLFPAEQDRVYRNLGDGRFEEVTQSCGVVVDEGKGLAVLAADFDNSGRISVFVGNDTTPNFFFENTSSKVGQINFAESGLIRGLALDGEGRSQATMGIACGDIDSDGLFDLFVTNFYEVANTMYRQQSSGYFADATRSTGLYQPSFQMLGFGTEFLDADLDGKLDLFITNGHVDQTAATGEPDMMPAQFFQNSGDGFIELTASQLGEYFHRKLLGRTVSRLDWNGDGLPDLCVLGLYTPVALLSNRSEVTDRQSLEIRLVGTKCDREAIGAKVSIRYDGEHQSQQLVAGDGYLTANERIISFGTPVNTNVEVQVEWPNGATEQFNALATGQSVVIVEKGGLFSQKQFSPTIK